MNLYLGLYVLDLDVNKYLFFFYGGFVWSSSNFDFFSRYLFDVGNIFYWNGVVTLLGI